MRQSLWPVLIVIAIFVFWVLAKVVANMRKSEQQWQAVDKSKLKTWDDEEDD